MAEKTNKNIAENRKVYHNYYIEEKHETGIELSGTEVKSMRQGHVQLADAYAEVRNDELWLIAMHISPYEHGNRFNLDPLRNRRLLAHKAEIKKLNEAVMRDGMTLVPLRLYFVRGRIKVELGIAKGKKLYDKRDAIASRDTTRRIEQHLKQNLK